MTNLYEGDYLCESCYIERENNSSKHYNDNF